MTSLFHTIYSFRENGRLSFRYTRFSTSVLAVCFHCQGWTQAAAYVLTLFWCRGNNMVGDLYALYIGRLLCYTPCSFGFWPDSDVIYSTFYYHIGWYKIWTDVGTLKMKKKSLSKWVRFFSFHLYIKEASSEAYYIGNPHFQRLVSFNIHFLFLVFIFIYILTHLILICGLALVYLESRNNFRDGVKVVDFYHRILYSVFGIYSDNYQYCQGEVNKVHELGTKNILFFKYIYI